MKKLIKLIPLLFITTLMATSCLKDNETAPYIPRAALKMVNAYSNAQSLVFADENNYLTPIPIKYSEYMLDPALLYPGNRRIKVYSNENKMISDTTLNLKDSTYYTSFIFGNTEKAKNLITKEIALANIDGNSAIRFLHLASNLGPVAVHFNTLDNVVYSNRALESTTLVDNPSTLYKAQTSGKQKIIITDATNNVLIEREYEFLKSRYYSIILIGDKNSTATPLYLGIVQQ